MREMIKSLINRNTHNQVIKKILYCYFNMVIKASYMLYLCFSLPNLPNFGPLQINKTIYI